MEIRDAQNKIAALFGEMTHPRLGSFTALVEEVGEIADQVMKIEIYDEKKDTHELAGEMADVLVSLCELANVYGIDLSEAFDEKIADLAPRAEEWKKKLVGILREKRLRLD